MNTNPYRIHKYLDHSRDHVRVAYMLINPNGQVIAEGMSWRVARHLANSMNLDRKISRLMREIFEDCPLDLKDMVPGCDGSDFPQ